MKNKITLALLLPFFGNKFIPQMYTNRRSENSFECQPCIQDKTVGNESEANDQGSSRPICGTCHDIRHALNLSPVDVVFGLCDSPKCQFTKCGY